MEDAGTRQLPGNARMADLWSARSIGAPEMAGGWGMSGCQQAGALCRVDRAQPKGRARGVRCTPWLGGNGYLILEGKVMNGPFDVYLSSFSTAI